MAKKPVNNRRKRAEQIRKQHERAERRGTIIAIALATLLGAGLIGGAVFATRDKRGEPLERLSKIGIAESEASCGELKKDDEKASGANDHRATGETITYPSPPPASGPHWDPSQLVPRSARFAARDTNYQPEQYVHNLEHGYVVVWYDADLPDDQLDQLREASEIGGIDKFMVAPWTRGKFEGSSDVVMASWARKIECTKFSGAALADFYETYGPDGDENVAPEPAAA